MGLYGRDEQLAQVAAAKSRVVVVAGAPGSGKSALLEALSHHDPGGRSPLAACPVPLPYGPGGLQRALLEAFGDVATRLAGDEHRAKQLGRRLAAAGKQMAAAMPGQVAGAVGAALLGLVGKRLGPPVADALKGSYKQLAKGMHDDLQARITRASDGGVIDALLGFAAEICALATGRPVLIALDDGENLGEDDARHLADLCSRLPVDLQVRLAFASSAVDGEPHLNLLSRAGAEVVLMEGLKDEVVANWLADEGCSRAALRDVMRVTRGFPVHVKAAIALLKEGQNLEALQPEEAIRRWSGSAYRACGSDAREAALSLAAFRFPPPLDFLPQFLGMSESRWTVVERELWDSQVFTVRVGERPWFHELHRQCTWDLIGVPHRGGYIDHAIDEVCRWLQQPDQQPQWLDELGRLAIEYPQRWAGDTCAFAVLQATEDEIAITAAITELAEPSRPMIDVENVLTLARETYGASGDLLAALVRLATAELIRLSSDLQEPYVGAVWTRDDDADLLIRARASRELGRTPIASLTTTLLHRRILPLAPGFTTVYCGIGTPSAALLSASAGKSSRRDSAHPNPQLLLWVDCGPVPWHGRIVFESNVQLDAARRNLAALDTELYDMSVTIRYALPFPVQRVPAWRLLAVYKQLTRHSLLPGWQLPLEIPLGIDEWMDRHARTLQFAYEVSTSTERLASDLKEPRGLIYAATDEFYVTSEVTDLTGARRVAIERLADLTVRGPFQALRMQQAAELRPGQRVGRTTEVRDPTAGYRSHDPIVEMLQRVVDEASKFNVNHNPALIPSNARRLQAMLTASLQRTTADAARLGAIAYGPRWKNSLSNETVYLCIREAEVNEDWGSAVWAVAHGSAEPSVRVVITPPGKEPDSSEDVEAAVRGAFALSPDTPPLHDHACGSAAAKITEILGHSPFDVVFEPMRPTRFRQ